MDEVAVTAPGTGGSGELDYDDVVASASAALDRMRDLRDALDSLRVDAVSGSGDIRVTVDGSGALVDLTLAPAAMSRPATDLGREIVSTTEQAAREAFVRHGEIVREHGADAPVDTRPETGPDAPTGAPAGVPTGDDE